MFQTKCQLFYQSTDLLIQHWTRQIGRQPSMSNVDGTKNGIHRWQTDVSIPEVASLLLPEPLKYGADSINLFNDFASKSWIV